MKLIIVIIEVVLFIIILISTINSVLVESVQHFGNWSTIRRHRRALIFNGGGAAKFIGGAIYPLYLEDKVHWRQVNCLYNFQTQYTTPDKPLYWWDKWNEGRSLFMKTDNNREKKLSLVPDDSRKFVYLALENFMNIKGRNGKKCLLRAICENVQITDHIGIFSEFLHILLKPGKENIDDDYKDAYNAGKSGADCISLYPECPQGDSFLDSLAVTV